LSSCTKHHNLKSMGFTVAQFSLQSVYGKETR